MRALGNAGHVTGHAGHETGERRPRDGGAPAKGRRAQSRTTHIHARRRFDRRAAGHMWRVTGAGRGAGKTRGSRAGGRSSEVT